MKRVLFCSLLAFVFSALITRAGEVPETCFVHGIVACQNGSSSAGIEVCIAGVGSDTTDDLGLFCIEVPCCTATYTVCVKESTLPADATIKDPCQDVDLSDPCAFATFTLCGPFCTPPPPEGLCWLTGGGTVGKLSKKVPHYSYGGVVYPGCSPDAAGGGNWNVVDHLAGLHFQGQDIIVDNCSGVATRSPKVNVNIIDFHGTGIIGGIGGNPEDTIPVTFVGRAIDNSEPGHRIDKLFIQVFDGGNTVLQIGDSADSPATISTGNLQIHTSSCNN